VAPTQRGLYGIEDETGTVAAFNATSLQRRRSSSSCSRRRFTMHVRTGAVTGISRLALRFVWPDLLIAILMVVFALGGTSYGMWEETLGFYALLVALTLAMGFDRMVGAAIILLGAGTGIIASTVNPFATGVASDAAGIALSDGLLLRVIMWIVLVPVAIGYVLWYARRVGDPSGSRSWSWSRLRPPQGTRGRCPLSAGRGGAVIFLGAFW
jgi:hypothetical protein